MGKSTTARVLIVVLVIAVAAIVFFVFDNGDPAASLTAPLPSAGVEPTRAPAQAETTAVTAPETADNSTAAGGDASTGSAAQAAPTGAVTFAIDQSASEARFVINEVLLGIPTEVTGVTNQISGTVMVDPANPAQSQVGVFSVNARELRTDRDLRNRAIRRFILESGRDEYQYITFTPTVLSGLPAQAAPGDAFTFQVTGDLKIKDVTQPVTFDVELTADSATQVSGLATATVKRSDFNLSIPSAPGVADVTDEVRLELAFTAVAQQG